MKPLNNTLVCLAAVLLFITACSEDATNQTIETEVQETLTATLDTAIDANIAVDNAGLIMSVIEDGEVVYTGMKGLARQGVDISKETPFRLASVSKTFTAIGILKLYERGVISLEDSILNFIPDLDESWRDITLHQLLAHQSGIPDFYNDFNAAAILPNGITNANTVQFFAANPALEFLPGTSEEYSNTGYLLLAEVIARQSGQTFADFMQSEIFSVIGMNSTYILDENAVITDDTAYNLAQSNLIFGDEFFAVGTAGQVSSMQDMVLFVKAFLAGDLLQPETQELMLQVHSSTVFEGYGYGILYFNPALTTYGHTGGNDGFRTIFVVAEPADAAVIILGNGGDALPDYGFLIDLVGEFIGAE